MGCPSEVEIGNNLTFSIPTHDPDTGVNTDADAVPTYRVYEDGGETAILSGDMDDGSGANSEFDDANTTGLYVKTIACTVANGFEEGKTYTVYIRATVDSDTGAITYNFKAVSAVYHADIQLTVDEANSKDEYTVVWFKNGVRVASGITSPTIQVVRRADGTDLVAAQAMTEIGSTGAYKYDESSNRVTAGEAVVAVAAATINAASRSFAKVLTRDSSS